MTWQWVAIIVGLPFSVLAGLALCLKANASKPAAPPRATRDDVR